ncbi:MAG: LacI family DNA-binding transcriptional regulator [Chloroflexia bacterium]|nr:LacI family DNA-binding transcriptional regulator [Chloroflexia bacterium]
MRAKGPTLYEVAERAGVSIATVSRVARGLGQISLETRTRVLAAIDDLNYHPSHFGRALVKRQHGTLGIVFPGLRGPYYSEVIHGFEVEAIAAGMSLLILGAEHLPSADAQVLGMADRADGLAIMGGTIGDALIQRLARRDVPIVTMARAKLPGIPNVRVDNYASTLALVTHLIHEHGYRRLEFVGNIVGAPDALERWRGFERAHRDAGLDPPSEPLSSAFEHTSGMQAALHILDLPERPRAIVCGNDEIASGMTSTLAAVGVRVPHEIAVTGWDNSPFARYTTPPLTTIAQPARALGQQTATMLLALIARNGDVEEEVVLSTEPIIRASCGCRFDPSTRFAIVNRQPNSHKEGAIIDELVLA